ncbi:MAG: hypothetical protein NT016_03150 [Candidatus Aenigmarchaeota archaeon]|nr:hypothetical protein [Candidatus Aenigmarchaeota archaeon]
MSNIFKAEELRPRELLKKDYRDVLDQLANKVLYNINPTGLPDADAMEPILKDVWRNRRAALKFLSKDDPMVPAYDAIETFSVEIYRMLDRDRRAKSLKPQEQSMWEDSRRVPLFSSKFEKHAIIEATVFIRGCLNYARYSDMCAEGRSDLKYLLERFKGKKEAGTEMYKALEGLLAVCDRCPYKNDKPSAEKSSL